jgi:hypothetical protein
MEVDYAHDRILLFAPHTAHFLKFCTEQKRSVRGTDICAVGMDTENVSGQCEGLFMHRVHASVVRVDANFKLYDCHYCPSPFSSMDATDHQNPE